eukprot:CAMPEP_0114665364 /NCGR_PEP_ID=MMETSP0191-20121206/30613_1 /TAXON_ID=126664 /ORGANISM="Sorites sp." /LENGTH=178 /DNA_ID=CAMNT_0001910191 /DNA_START=134 /DNA_END=670 /DNA_ORIENTATION=-
MTSYRSNSSTNNGNTPKSGNGEKTKMTIYDNDAIIIPNDNVRGKKDEVYEPDTVSQINALNTIFEQEMKSNEDSKTESTITRTQNEGKHTIGYSHTINGTKMDIGIKRYSNSITNDLTNNDIQIGNILAANEQIKYNTTKGEPNNNLTINDKMVATCIASNEIIYNQVTKGQKVITPF